MGTHPIFESDFDCLTEKNKYAFMNDIEAQVEKAVQEKNALLESGKLSRLEYGEITTLIQSAKAELDYYKQHFRRYDCPMDQGKILHIGKTLFDFNSDMQFPIRNFVSGTVGDIFIPAKPVILSSDKINRRALEITVEVTDDNPKDIILIELYCEGDIRNTDETIREIFLGKSMVTAIIPYLTIREKVSEDEFQIFVGHRAVDLKKLKIMKDTIEQIKRSRSESLIPNRKAKKIPKPSLIPSRFN